MYGVKGSWLIFLDCCIGIEVSRMICAEPFFHKLYVTMSLPLSFTESKTSCLLSFLAGHHLWTNKPNLCLDIKLVSVLLFLYITPIPSVLVDYLLSILSVPATDTCNWYFHPSKPPRRHDNQKTLVLSQRVRSNFFALSTLLIPTKPPRVLLSVFTNSIAWSDGTWLKLLRELPVYIECCLCQLHYVCLIHG